MMKISVLYGPGYIPPLGDNSLGVVARVPESTPLDSLVKSGSSISFPRAYCLKLYGGVDCAGRSFKHSCPTFEGPHRAFNCNFCAFGRSTGHSLGLEEPVSPAWWPESLPQSTSPTNSENLLLFLSMIIQLWNLLHTSITEGFPLHYEGFHYSCHASSLISAVKNPAVVDAKLAIEL